MNHASYPYPSLPAPREIESEGGRDFIDLERLFAMAKRQAKVVAGCVVVGLMLGILYLQTTPPRYVSFANVLIDEGLNKMVDEVSSTPTNLQSDAAILSQIEIVKSARLADVVAAKLRLDENDAFLRPPTSLLAKSIGFVRGAIRSVLSSSQPNAAVVAADDGERQNRIAAARKKLAASMLRASIAAQRVGRSYVVAMAYSSTDPRLAEAITRAYADAYVADQLDASFEAAEKAAIWLEGRLAELKVSSQQASLEVERFRSANGLAAARGSLMSEQQLAELNGQLAIAQADTARAMARYDQYRTFLSGDIDAAAVSSSILSELPDSSNIATLRTTLSNLTKRQQDVIAKFGSEHPQAQALEREKSSLLEQIVGQVRQLADGFRGEYEVALAREQALRASMDTVSGTNSEANQAMVRLRELEQQATALTSLYQTFLARYEETAQQQTFPVSRVRIISEATSPTQPTSPRTTMVLGLSIALGLLIGVGVSGLNEFNERFFRTGDELRSKTGIKFLGYLPIVGDRPRPRPAKRTKPGEAGVPPEQEGGMQGSGRMRVAVENPASIFAETLRNTKIASDVVLQDVGCKVIGVISVLPGEGKSTVAANFAALLAAYGCKTLLIDGDLRNPRLTRELGFNTHAGLIEAVVENQSWQSVAKIDRAGKFAFIPSIVRSRFSHSSELLSSRGMRTLLDSAKQSFEYIIVDLPPLGPIVDAKAFAPLADGFVMVIEWGKTPRSIVDSVLSADTQVSHKIVGAVFNKVDMNKLGSYGAAGGSEKFFDRYSEYYLDGKTQSSKAPVEA